MAGKTSTQRVHEHRARKRSAGEIPAVRHRRVRAACKDDLVRFGMTYFSAFLNHAPSERMRRELIDPLQRMILGGGQEVILFPRSAGKSTWTKIAIAWALLYAHKRFVIVVASTRELAESMHKEIVGSLGDEGMEHLGKDFPGVCVPLRACQGDSRKVSSVTVNGETTGMEWRSTRFVFPTVRNEDGTNNEPSAGAVLIAGSVGGAIKGAVKRNERPDLIILDDPQTRKIAESHTMTDKAEKFIEGDVMGLCGQTSVYSAVMTITPMIQGDLAARFTDPKRHPEWHVSKAQYCSKWTDTAEKLLPLFREAYAEDVSTGEFTWEKSRAFYEAHLNDFANVEVLDPLNFAPGEVDAVHHLLVMRSRMTDEAFSAEYQLDVTVETGEMALSEDDVKTNLTGFPIGVLPPGTMHCVAFCDVNTGAGAGLRWGVLACGANRVTSMVAYGTYPADGKPLVPKGMDPATKRNLLIHGIKAVTHDILNLNFRLHTGAPVRPLALCFDGGYEQRTVADTVAWIGENVKMHGIEVMWSLGRNWQYYDKRERGEESVMKKDHVRSSALIDAKTGATKKFLVIQTDYWREVAQKAFRLRFPESGCCALFGDKPHIHSVFAAETTYERLVRTYVDEKTHKRAWEWYNSRKGHNHYGDVLVGCFALARWKDIYSAAPRQLKPGVVDMVEGKRGEVVFNSSPVRRPSLPMRRTASIFKPIRRPGR